MPALHDASEERKRQAGGRWKARGGHAGGRIAGMQGAEWAIRGDARLQLVLNGGDASQLQIPLHLLPALGHLNRSELDMVDHRDSR
jgi:hypothetical protein